MLRLLFKWDKLNSVSCDVECSNMPFNMLNVAGWNLGWFIFSLVSDRGGLVQRFNMAANKRLREPLSSLAALDSAKIGMEFKNSGVTLPAS